MTAKEFIEKRLSELQSEGAKANLPAGDLADFVFKTVMSKKFRKFKVTPESYVAHIKEAINLCIENNEPIKVLLPFGGYKLWRLEEAPEADWAELFALMYYAKWLMPITQIYKPGVWFDFSSDDIVVERLNNIPKTDTDSYARSFQQILDFMRKYLPENFKVTLTRVSSYCPEDKFEKELAENIILMEKKLGGLPVLTEADKHTIELNVKLKRGQGEDPLWREKVELMHQSYYTLIDRYEHNRAKDKFWAFPTQIGTCVAVGSTKTSIAKFWPGVGALKKTDGSFMEYVLSPSQITKADFSWQDISIDGLTGKNFNRIRIINS